MAADIIPIELGLTAGNGLTLWAPSWREDGEDWEAFLGHGDDLYVFPSPAHLAAFVRYLDRARPARPSRSGTAASELLVDELTPDDDHCFDIVGVPELVAEIRRTSGRWPRWPTPSPSCGRWPRSAGSMRSTSPRFDRRLQPAADGPAGFRRAQRREAVDRDRAAVIAERWDEVVDALDAIVKTPEVDESALELGLAEAAVITAAEKHWRKRSRRPTVEPTRRRRTEEERDEDLRFWDDTGVDCLEITVDGRTGYHPALLPRRRPGLPAGSAASRSTPRPRTGELPDDGRSTHRWPTLEVWPEIRKAVTDGDAAVLAGPENTYGSTGSRSLNAGPDRKRSTASSWSWRSNC